MKSTQEFIELLKTLYENCQVYFDIQEKKIIVKRQRTKEDQAKEPELEAEFKEIRIKLQQLKSAGVTADLPEPPPANIEEIYNDGVYQPTEAYFQWLITKLDEWETNQNKKLENVGSLVEFLEWAATEKDKLEKEAEETREKEVQEIISKLQQLELEQAQKAIDDVWKNNIHREFTPELQKQWEDNGFVYEQVKEWIGVGLKPQDSGYAAWIRDIFELSPLDYLNYLFVSSADGDDKLMREQYQQYLQTDIEEEDEDTILAKAIALSLGNDGNFEREEKTRNILLIGRTGSGKSTLANVLVNKDGQFEEVFKESAGSVSETKEIKTERFTLDISRDSTQQIHYLAIDTAGFGDTQLGEKEILQLLKGLVPIIKENGINQIFLVNNGRFKKDEVDIYRLLENVLFDENAGNYTTIVRTKFPNFENHTACEADKQQLQIENNEIARILQRSKIIYVVGKPVCSRGHDSNLRVYNNLGSLVSNHQSDFIGHIYCPTCGTNDYNFTLRNATTYTLEEWSRKSAQQAAERTRRMEEAIREQERQKQDMINRIMQAKSSQEAAFRRELDLQRENDELLLETQRLEREINLKKQRQDYEAQINSNASSRETNLRNQSNQQVQTFQAQIQQAQQGINSAQRTFFGVFPWLNLGNNN